jgi:hypothetical protein
MVQAVAALLRQGMGSAPFFLNENHDRSLSLVGAQGGRFGGWALYVKDGRPVYTYNWLGLRNGASQRQLAAGKNTIRFEFACAGKGGLGTILVNGQKVADARIDQTQCYMFSLDEGADVDRNKGTPVTEDYKIPQRRSTPLPMPSGENRDKRILED